MKYPDDSPSLGEMRAALAAAQTWREVAEVFACFAAHQTDGLDLEYGADDEGWAVWDAYERALARLG